MKISSITMWSPKTDIGRTFTRTSPNARALASLQPGGLPTAKPVSVPLPPSGEIRAPASSTFVPVIFGPKLLTPAFTIEPRKNASPT